MSGDKDDLRGYFQVIWKKKWLIITATFICVAATAVLSLSLPRKWEVDCIIKFSKFFIQSETGEFKETTLVNPQQISALINNDTYNKDIAQELGLSTKKFQKLEARELRGTNLIRVSLRTSDIDEGKSILLSLFKYLKRDLDSKIELEVKGLENLIANNKNIIQQKELSVLDRLNEIKVINNEKKVKMIDIQNNESRELEKQQEIKSAENLQKISQNREKSIQSELDEVKQRIKIIEQQHLKALGEEKKEGSALSLLLYSNEIQQNLQYLNILNEELVNERIKQENLMLSTLMKEGDIRNLKAQTAQTKIQIDTLNTYIGDKKNECEKIKIDIGNIKNSIALLEERKSRVNYTQLVKQPTSSLYPVSPKRKLNVLISFVLGITVFTLLAFILEYTKPKKNEA